MTALNYNVWVDIGELEPADPLYKWVEENAPFWEMVTGATKFSVRFDSEEELIMFKLRFGV